MQVDPKMNDEFLDRKKHDKYHRTYSEIIPVDREITGTRKRRAHVVSRGGYSSLVKGANNWLYERGKLGKFEKRNVNLENSKFQSKSEFPIDRPISKDKYLPFTLSENLSNLGIQSEILFLDPVVDGVIYTYHLNAMLDEVAPILRDLKIIPITSDITKDVYLSPYDVVRYLEDGINTEESKSTANFMKNVYSQWDPDFKKKYRYYRKFQDLGYFVHNGFKHGFDLMLYSTPRKFRPSSTKQPSSDGTHIDVGPVKGSISSINDIAGVIFVSKENDPRIKDMIVASHLARKNDFRLFVINLSSNRVYEVRRDKGTKYHLDMVSIQTPSHFNQMGDELP